MWWLPSFALPPKGVAALAEFSQHGVLPAWMVTALRGCIPAEHQAFVAATRGAPPSEAEVVRALAPAAALAGLGADGPAPAIAAAAAGGAGNARTASRH
jgi:hypothetical protein